jgi:hypothetical protein
MSIMLIEINRSVGILIYSIIQWQQGYTLIDAVFIIIKIRYLNYLKEHMRHVMSIVM